jgi:hypothetical protein
MQPSYHCFSGWVARSGRNSLMHTILVSFFSVDFLLITEICGAISYCKQLTMACQFELPVQLPYLPECKMPLIWANPQIKYICQGKMYLSKSNKTPKNKTSPRNTCFIINFIHLIHKAVWFGTFKQPHICKHQIWGKTLILHLSKYGTWVQIG